MGSNHRPSGYEPDELPLLYSAPHLSFGTKADAKLLHFFDMTKFLNKKVQNICFFLRIRIIFSTFAA